jgi:hypothetical protein
MAASSTTSIVIFILLTLVYTIFNYYTKNQYKYISLIYFLILILSQFLINLGLTTEICGSKQYGLAVVQATLIPWILIFGSINILLMIFPSWLSPFSNTIGYLFAYITGVNSFFKSILKDRKLAGLAPDQAGMVSALNNVYDDKSLLINSITNNNITEWWNSMIAGKLLKPNVGNSELEKLKQYIEMKTDISKFIWYLLTGVLTISVSYNSILNANCNMSAKEMEKRHDEYIAQEKKMEKEKQEKEKSKIVYKSYE